MPTGRPVAVSHSRTVPSPPAQASSLPSALNATPCTPYGPLSPEVGGPPYGPLVSAEMGGPAGGRVPQPDGAVAAGAGQQLAIRAERHTGRADTTAAAGEGRAG